MAKKFPLTKKAFGEFISTKHGAEFRRGSNDRCPLTRALQAIRPKAKGDDEPINVGDYETLPKWAIRFMELYDGTTLESDGPLSAYAAAVRVGAIR